MGGNAEVFGFCCMIGLLITLITSTYKIFVSLALLLRLRCWEQPAGSFGALRAAAVHTANHPVQSPETFPNGQNWTGVAQRVHR